MVFYALELLGSMPPGSARSRLAEVPTDADAFLDGLWKIFEGRDVLETACALLDHSAARACAARSRDSGVFYTPLPVARYIFRRAIGSYLLHGIKSRAGGPYVSVEEAITGLDGSELRFFYNDLKSTRVLDSSCGSGVFLQAALEELCRLRAMVLERAGRPVEPDIKKDIVENNLYGMDVEPYSVDVAALRLRLLLSGSDKPETIRNNLTCEDALFTREAGPFEVIVGNPPYMRVKSMFSDSLESAKRKKGFADAVRASRLYRYQEGNLNLYKLFVERNLAFLKDGGSMGLIIPSSFLNEATSGKLRKHLFDTCRMEEVVEIPELSRVFTGVSQATAILILGKSRAGDGSFTLRLGAGAGDLGAADGSISITYKELEKLTSGMMGVPLLRRPSLEWDMIKRLKSIPPFKGDGRVPPVGEIYVGHVDETINKEYVTEVPTGDIFVKGIHLREYSVDLSPGGRQPRWVKKAEFIRSRPSALPTISQWRIIGRNTQNKACARRLKFALLPPGYVCGNSVKQIIMTDELMEPLYLLGLLNSSVLNWYFELFCSQNNIRNYNIEALPIVRAPGDVQDAFARVAGLIMGSTGEAREFLDMGLMDSMAYELYFKDHAGLISAIGGLRGHGDHEFIRHAMSDEAISQRINGLMREEPYKLIREATFKPHATGSDSSGHLQKAKNYI
jgi:Alw26I/Eco31I/Esp3I family type II restriction m6 adenine DNA methyltransferase